MVLMDLLNLVCKEEDEGFEGTSYQSGGGAALCSVGREADLSLCSTFVRCRFRHVCGFLLHHDPSWSRLIRGFHGTVWFREEHEDLAGLPGQLIDARSSYLSQNHILKCLNVQSKFIHCAKKKAPKPDNVFRNQ